MPLASLVPAEPAPDPAEPALPTLGEKLGIAPHISGLLHKARRLGLDAELLEKLAIKRGCSYYHDRTLLEVPDIPQEALSDSELAIALLHIGLRYHPQTLRLGAAMLSSNRNTPESIARLATLERCEIPVRYVAEAGKRMEPRNPFWQRLLELIPARPPPKDGVMPHPTRFVAMTGFTRHGAEPVIQWIRPA